MYNQKSWQEFSDSGLLWWMNNILHTFGWAIVIERDTDTRQIIEVFPARVTCRGFPEKSNINGYKKVSKYIKDNAEILYQESISDEQEHL